jgi:hypothetical protein
MSMRTFLFGLFSLRENLLDEDYPPDRCRQNRRLSERQSRPGELVDWSERAMMDAEFDEADIEVLSLQL